MTNVVKMIKIIVLLVLSFVSCTLAVNLKYVSCGSTATVHSIVLEPCAVEPCIIHLQQNYTAWINFTARVNHDTAYNFASGDVTGAGTEEIWNINPNDACGVSVKCPIQAGLEQTYKASVTVPITNPKRMAAKWQIKDTNDRNAKNPMICFVFPVTIIA